jgi:hypothetical protein
LPLGDREALDRWWNKATPDEKIGAVRQAIAEVAIHRAKRRGGNRFDETRVEIGWRWDLFLRAADRSEKTAAPGERERAEALYLDEGFEETQRSFDANGG